MCLITAKDGGTMSKYIGRSFVYKTHTGERRMARCTGIEMDTLIGKPIFVGISPFGHRVCLSKSEIEKFI